MEFKVSSDILNRVAAMDRFLGVWASGGVSPQTLRRLADAARIQSVAASSRLSGSRVSDEEVAGILRGEPSSLLDQADILGYAAAHDAELAPPDRDLATADLRRLHGLLLGGGEPSRPEWRKTQKHAEAFDAEGRATGQIFPTLPPRLVVDATDEIVAWFNVESAQNQHHPILIIGVFVLRWLAISPFDRGNARMSRLLMGRLLERAGYEFLPQASLEAELELRRDEYYFAYDRSHTHLWTDRADFLPWLDFFTRTLEGHRRRVETKLELERGFEAFAPLQQAILETVREHGSVNAGLLIQATGANRNTLKDNLRRLVDRGVLEKTGQRRGTRYRMAGLPSAGLEEAP